MLSISLIKMCFFNRAALAFHLTQNEFKVSSCIIQYDTFITTGLVIYFIKNEMMIEIIGYNISH